MARYDDREMYVSYEEQACRSIEEKDDSPSDISPYFTWEWVQSVDSLD